MEQTQPTKAAMRAATELRGYAERTGMDLLPVVDYMADLIDKHARIPEMLELLKDAIKQHDPHYVSDWYEDARALLAEMGES